jgi:hypothetical protein
MARSGIGHQAGPIAPTGGMSVSLDISSSRMAGHSGHERPATLIARISGDVRVLFFVSSSENEGLSRTSYPAAAHQVDNQYHQRNNQQ